VNTNSALSIRKENWLGRRLPLWLAAAFVALGMVLVVGVQSAAAQDVGLCVQDLALLDDAPNNNNLQCTSNDVTIAKYNILNGVTSCIAGEDVTVELQAEVVGGSDARYDIGLFIALDGGTGLTGLCSRDFLTPTATVGGFTNLTSGVGPYLNLENNADKCGDVEQDELNLKNLQTVTIKCEDEDNDGILDVGSCISWDQQDAAPQCTSLLNTVPGSNAKCRCEPVQIGDVIVQQAARLQVIKDIVPNDAPGAFNLVITGTFKLTPTSFVQTYMTQTLNVGDNGTTGIITVPVGSNQAPGGRYTVTESAGAATTLADYTSIVSCVRRGTTTPVLASGALAASLTITPGDDIVCTFTNSYNKGTLQVVKDVAPDDPATNWAFTATGRSLMPVVNIAGDGAGAVQTVLTGTYAITETAGANTNLADYTTTWACTENGASYGSGSGTVLSVAVNANKAVVCTFTNTRKTGTVIITKVSNGGDGVFPFTGTGSGISPTFSITTTGGTANRTFLNVPTGTKYVTETVPTGWDLTNIVCSDPDNGSSVSLANKAATLDVDHNETVNCTFTNVKRGSLTITKTVDWNGFDPDPNQTYEICVTGPSYAGCGDAGATKSFPFNGGSQTWTDLIPGVYTVTEQSPTQSQGWMITIGNSPVTVPAGGSAGATVTNKRLQGELLILKTATTVFTRTFDWDIVKSVNPPVLNLFEGQPSVPVTYTIIVTKTLAGDSGFLVNGTVVVSNTSALTTVVNQPLDKLSNGTVVTLICPGVTFPKTLAPGAQFACSYSQPLGSSAALTNSVTVSLTNGTLFTGTAAVTFGNPTTLISDAVTISDTNGIEYPNVGGGSGAASFDFTYNESFGCSDLRTVYTGTVGGYDHVNVASLLGRNESDDATLRVNCFKLDVSKSANPAYTLTYTWAITKDVAPAVVDLLEGDATDVTYTVTVQRDNGTPGSHFVSGSVVITNPAPMSATVNLADVISNFGAVTTSCANPVVIAGNSQVSCAYATGLDGDETRNDATATLYGVNYTATAPIDFGSVTPLKVNEAISVTDSYTSATGMPWSFSSVSGSVSYDRPMNCSDVGAFTGGVATKYVDNTATITQTGADDDATVRVNCYRPLVSKDATPSFTRTYSWEITKTVTPESVDLFDGETANVTYTVSVAPSYVDSAFQVTGTVEIANPAPFTVTVDVADVLSDGSAANFTNCTNPVALGPESSVSCDYAAAPGAAVDGTNVVTVTTVFKAYTASAAFDFTDPTTEISKSITVDDINDVLADRSIGFTYGGSTSSVYSETVGCSLVNYNQGLNGQITINNTATVRGTAKSDSAQVDLNCYRLQATKNANTFFTETYNWALAKKASSTQLSFFDGDSAVVTYTLSVTKSAPVYSGQLVSGTIVISNPAPMAATLAAVTDVLGNLPATVSCPALTVAANSLLTCTYIVATPDQVNRTNVVTATQLLNNGGQTPYVGSALADFGAATVVKINDSIHVTDTNVSTVYPFSASGSASYTLPFTCANVQYNGLAGVKTVPNTAFVVETGANDSEIVRLDCYKLNVAKSAATSYTRTYTWTLDKSVSDTSLDLFEGETGTVTYTVDVVKTLLGESNFLVTGKITVTNPAPIAANVQSLLDAMTGPLNGTVNCGAVTSVAANSSLVCSYSAAPGDKTNRTNVATLTQKLGNGSTALYTGTAAVDFGSAQVTLVNDNAILSDPMMGQNVNLTNSGSVSYPSQVGCTDINFGVGTKVSFAQLNTALLLPYGFTDSESVSINCYRLAVSKTAVPTSTVGFDWTIEKSASPASLNLTSSQTAQVGYVVTVTKSIALQQNSVSGSIVISNPAPMAADVGQCGGRHDRQCGGRRELWRRSASGA
jgi:hypothetical protein